MGNQGTGFHENNRMLQVITARHLLHRTFEGLGRIKKAGQNLSSTKRNVCSLVFSAALYTYMIIYTTCLGLGRLPALLVLESEKPWERPCFHVS